MDATALTVTDALLVFCSFSNGARLKCMRCRLLQSYKIEQRVWQKGVALLRHHSFHPLPVQTKMAAYLSIHQIHKVSEKKKKVLPKLFVRASPSSLHGLLECCQFWRPDPKDACLSLPSRINASLPWMSENDTTGANITDDINANLRAEIDAFNDEDNTTGASITEISVKLRAAIDAFNNLRLSERFQNVKTSVEHSVTDELPADLKGKGSCAGGPPSLSSNPRNEQNCKSVQKNWSNRPLSCTKNSTCLPTPANSATFCRTKSALKIGWQTWNAASATSEPKYTAWKLNFILWHMPETSVWKLIQSRTFANNQPTVPSFINSLAVWQPCIGPLQRLRDPDGYGRQFKSH